MKQKQTKQHGRSMIEMLGVLAIIGVLSITALVGFTYAMNKHRANETIYDVMLRGTNVPMIDEYYANKPSGHEFRFPGLPGNGTRGTYYPMTTKKDTGSSYYVEATDVTYRVCEMILKMNPTDIDQIVVGNTVYTGDSDICGTNDGLAMKFCFGEDGTICNGTGHGGSSGGSGGSSGGESSGGSGSGSSGSGSGSGSDPDPIPCNLSKDCSGILVCINGTCQEPPDDPSCTTDGNCTGDQVCVNGECEKPTDCESNLDCGNGLICTDGECKNPPPCTDDSDCTGDQICENGTCGDPDCTQNSDCGDLICESGRCVPPECTNDGECGEGQQCVDGQCEDIDCTQNPTLPYCICKDSGNYACCMAPSSSEDCVRFCVTHPENCVNDPCPNDEQTDAICCAIMVSGSWENGACTPPSACDEGEISCGSGDTTWCCGEGQTCGSQGQCCQDSYCCDGVPYCSGADLDGCLSWECCPSASSVACSMTIEGICREWICCPDGTPYQYEGGGWKSCCPFGHILCDYCLGDPEIYPETCVGQTCYSPEEYENHIQNGGTCRNYQIS